MTIGGDNNLTMNYSPRVNYVEEWDFYAWDGSRCFFDHVI